MLIQLLCVNSQDAKRNALGYATLSSCADLRAVDKDSVLHINRKLEETSKKEPELALTAFLGWIFSIKELTSTVGASLFQFLFSLDGYL